MSRADDRRFMELARVLGRRGQGRCWPNPAVGCVIVRDGRILGRARTAEGGRPHAEPLALAQAGKAQGATAYVTLEPCAHHGQTPPCAEALIAAGIARVVIGATDSDPRVAGRGVAMLRAAGIEVETGVCEAGVRADLAGFLARVETGRPALTLKLATSLDGRIATATGESRWITGPEARRAVHAMRARHDAVMVGGGTARADDPLLTVRDLGIDRQPVRVVVSRRLDLDPRGRLAASAKDAPLWLCHGPEAAEEAVLEWQALGARCLPCEVDRGQLSPRSVLDTLGAEGLTSVFCEGGGAWAASLLDAGLADELAVISAGLALGAEGTPALGAMGLGSLAEAPRFTLIETRPLGGDVLHRWARA